jgi:hypothetical protein
VLVITGASYTGGGFIISGIRESNMFLRRELMRKTSTTDKIIKKYAGPTMTEAQIKKIVHENEQWSNKARLEAAAPDMLEALKDAESLVKIARQYFPKSIQNGNKFTLENTCAAIGKAIAKAEGRE